jgi:thiol:disulfide interchange protein/DsbC/DsbD-like thiol-disulfide interchange protein
MAHYVMRLLRHLLLTTLLLACVADFARASDPIPEPASGKSNTVTQPHVTAELITETTSLATNKPFDVILHLHMDKDWHTYWINTGDAGLATRIKWTLPPGLTAGPIQWPTPELHAMGPLTTYGYGGDVYLLTTITPNASADSTLPSHFNLQAKASWLVCQEECIPGKAELSLPVTYMPDASAVPPATSVTTFFTAARARLPVPNTRWDVAAAYQHVGLADALVIHFKEKGAPASLGQPIFFPEQGNVLAPKNEVTSPALPANSPEFDLVYSLQQNGEKPDHLSGVLVSDQPLIGSATAVEIGPFSTHASIPPVPSASIQSSSPAQAAGIGSTPSPATTASPVSPASHPEPVEGSVPPASAPLLLTILGFAFLGGLILNLMPCVLPVLSLKVFSLIKHAGENSGTAWRQGLAFTCGVVVSFWILAGLLIALRAAGNHLGWGFQMQSPGFVLALTFLFFLLALNLFGVFELGASLVGLDAKASSHLGGLTSSFANGALATLAATPCTAPFMGSSVGFAAQQPAAISLLIFTVLGLGMAAPYLALTVFPGALRLVPEPGAWMEALKQFMGFLLMGTVIFLVYVFGSLVGEEQVPALLGALLVAGFAAWLYGRWTSPLRAPAVRLFACVVSLLVLAGAVAWGAQLALAKPIDSSHEAAANGWQTYSPDAVKQALAQNRPVFVDFTAAWCLSCKVNEAVALDIDSTKQAFTQKNVALFRGDWTHSDPQISDMLRSYNRDGVPLYLLYSPKNPDQPQVLPQVLTPGIVQDALQKL